MHTHEPWEHFAEHVCDMPKASIQFSLLPCAWSKPLASHLTAATDTPAGADCTLVIAGIMPVYAQGIAWVSTKALDRLLTCSRAWGS